ncbi:NAD-dependent epimerase/dehydratase family protein [Pseudoxanthomonas winnipegensis]|uniref:NAD-dependent epimerase/dehydratase family protein n=1 Tax=Pseudoxanthomonas winnipegensis TaxID=2480810 RepID=UPI003F84CCD9
MAIFVTGASGFIGGAVAARLVANGYQVRGLVRDGARAEQLARLGIVPVLGHLDDRDLIVREARAADGAINAADSDHRGAAVALIEGLSGSGKPLLHTSGTGLYVQDTRGEASEQTYADDAPLPSEVESGDRASIDRHVLDAAARGIRSIVLCNSCVYGWGAGLHRESIMVPWLKRQAQEDGVARFIGSGANVWSNVHIDDLVDLYLLALDQAPAGSRYLVENGQSTFADLAQAIADRLGLGQAQSWSVEEAAAHVDETYAFIFGSHCRVRATRARAELRWQPKVGAMLDWIRQEG